MLFDRDRYPRFLGDEGGNVTIFSVLMMILILMITGASVDIMRLEATRVQMQATMDRAVLAAADLDQLQDPEDVVLDYVHKAGLSPYLGDVSVAEGLNERRVSADADTTLDSIFLHLSGIDALEAIARSIAEERVANIEISLVLDVSGSMSGSRIENLRDAANEFIDTVIIEDLDDNSGLTTVSIVPYNATVNLGETYGAYWTVSDLHDYSNCPIFDANAFFDTSIDPGVELERLAHFDLYSSNQSTTSISSPWCPTGDTSGVIAVSSDTTALKSRITSLTAGGNTAIDLGMKWGVALLDPDTRPAIVEMVEDGLVDANASTRPAAYDDIEALKFVVVMTDGANTTEFDLKSKYKYGMSDVWIDDRGNSDPSDDRFSLLVDDNYGSSNDVYFWKRYEESGWSTRNRSTPDGGSAARRMSNPELFARFGTKAVAQKMYTKPYYDGFVSYDAYYDIYYAYESIVNGAAADSRLSNVCRAAKDQGIVVFAIAFEAPEGGQLALQDCASSMSHYFDVEGVEITETFHAIARQINNLRLIQ